ncbi:MAG TPA: hypothetical protein VGW75_03375 [Solirubrobacteraceae bacterium]|jgi:hypothetical protein|nr:hypothetical protein [Solirubrobacteraceae bacterium]
MRRLVSLTVLVLLALAAVAAAHELDHAPPAFVEPAGPLSSEVRAGGQDAEWELITTIPTGNPHTDLDFFTIGEDTYMSAGTLGVGPNAGGQTIVRLTEKGVVNPTYVSSHPSAACPGVFTSATGLQHDVEATPKGNAFQQQPNLHVARGDAQLLVDSTDAPGRCHDNGDAGIPNTVQGVPIPGRDPVPNGGLELIDVTDVKQPKELALISHIGNAHTVNVDPKRPHIAFDVTQDGVTNNPQTGLRNNETDGSTSNALDGFEVIDMSSCMNFAPRTSLEEKRARCDPKVYRYRYPEARMATSHQYPNALQSCHELEIYPDDRIACASITSTILFDLSNAFDDNGTPTNYLDDRPRGTPLPCKRRESSSRDVVPGLKTGAPVIDCVVGSVGGKDQPLRVSEWKKIGSPSLEGVEWLGTVPHMGFSGTETIVTGPRGSAIDVLAAHESELTQSGRYVITSDERGGGIVPGGASCSPGVDNPIGNGGMHFFPVAKFTKDTPLTTEQADKLHALTPQGQKAVYRATIRTEPQGSICTAHVFQQIPGQNRIFMGWYSQGTQVFDFTENDDGTVSLREAGWFTPEHADTWVSHVFKAQRNQDGTFTYWGAASDGILPGSGRSAIDVYKVTLPPAPEPAGGPAPGTPEIPASEVRGVENERAAPCASSTAFERVSVRPRGRGLAFSFRRRGRAAVTVDLFRASRGRRVGDRRVKRFVDRTGAFRWNGRRGDRGRRVVDGYYHARFQTRTASGGRDTRRVALVRRGGRWRLRPQFYRRIPCALAETFKLSRPVFGGRRRTPLGVSFRLNQAADVEIEVRQGGRVVARVPRRTYLAGRTIRLRIAASRVPRRGDVRVTMRAVRTGRSATHTLTARRL